MSDGTSRAVERERRHGGVEVTDPGAAEPALELTGGGLARCRSCGWDGVPTFAGGTGPSIGEPDDRRPTQGGTTELWCPKCQTAPLVDAMRRSHLPPAGVPVRVGPKVGRNAPCPCGSNIKAKRCPCAGSYT